MQRNKRKAVKKLARLGGHATTFADGCPFDYCMPHPSAVQGDPRPAMKIVGAPDCRTTANIYTHLDEVFADKEVEKPEAKLPKGSREACSRKPSVHESLPRAYDFGN